MNMNIYDADATELIQEVSVILKEEYPQVEKPPAMKFWKTGLSKEYPPEDPDFWYIRCASILRKLYRGPIGVSEFRKIYGGRKTNTTRKARKRLASGAIIRRCIQQLEKENLVQKSPKGRVLTNAGKSLLDKTASKLIREKPKVPGPF